MQPTKTDVGQLSKVDFDDLKKAGVIPQNTPPAQLAIFAHVCKELGLSPFSKEVYLTEVAGKWTVMCGIDGFRRRAAETGLHMGTDDPKFDLKSDGSFKSAFDLKAENKMPTTCTITTYKAVGGQKCPFTHTAVFAEFSSGKNKWQSMPFQMIAKVAEAFSLRKGFPERLQGLSIPEESVAIEDAQIFETTRAGFDDDTQYLDEIRAMLNQCKGMEDLVRLYKANPQWQGDDEITGMFTAKKVELNGN